jgi:hypothetical protein
MSLLPVAVTGVMLMTTVLIVLLALGGAILVAYLLVAPMRRGLDGWMNRQEADIWADTLAFVDAQKELYQRPQRREPVSRRESNKKQKPVVKQEEPALGTPA